MAKKKKVVRKQTIKKKIVKRPKVVYVKERQTNVPRYDEYRDMTKEAMPPGKRIPKSGGKPYYEYRKNRTDKPGELTGVRENLLDRCYREYGEIQQMLIFLKNQKPSKHRTDNLRTGKKMLAEINKNISILKRLK